MILHTSHQATNSPKPTISVPTKKLYKTYINNIKHKLFEELVISVLPTHTHIYRERERYNKGILS